MNINTSKLWKGCLLLNLILILILIVSITEVKDFPIAYVVGIILSFTSNPLLSLVVIIGLQLIFILINIYIAKLCDNIFLRERRPIPPYISLQSLIYVIIISQILYYLVIYYNAPPNSNEMIFHLSVVENVTNFCVECLCNAGYMLLCWTFGGLANKTIRLFVKTEKTEA